jgi:uncharacterized membrane protein YjjP (DUF1212 family)
MKSVPLVEHKLLSLSEHRSSPPVVSEFHAAQSMALSVLFSGSFVVFLSLFILAIGLYVLLRSMACHCPFCVFKLSVDQDKSYFNIQIH